MNCIPEAPSYSRTVQITFGVLVGPKRSHGLPRGHVGSAVWPQVVTWSAQGSCDYLWELHAVLSSEWLGWQNP